MKKIWLKWKEIAKKIGNFQTKVLFSVLYFLLVTPLGWVESLFNDSFKKRSATQWEKMTDDSSTLEKMRNQ